MFVCLVAMLTADIQDGPTWIAPWVEEGLEAPHWIWARDFDFTAPTPAGTSVDLAIILKRFELDRPAVARLVFAADNSATFTLDGDEVMKSSSHSTVSSFEIELDRGFHNLYVRAENGESTGVNPAGLVGVIDLTFENGDRERIITDGEWAAYPYTSQGTGPQRMAVDMGRCDIAPWGLSPSVFRESRACPILRRSFELESLPERATVRVIGLGHYELRLNGHDVSPTVIDQAWSQYDKRLFWQEFDLLPFLQVGENVFGVLLGNSFWRVDGTNDPNRFAKTDAMPDFSKGRPFLLWLVASFSFNDRANMRLTTDDDWMWDDGPLTFSHIYGGEDWDARLVQDGWDEPGFDDSEWSEVMVVDAPTAKLSRLPFPGLKEFERFEPTRIARPEPDVTTYVFPQNCSALLEFVIEGEPGDTVRFLPCEYLDPETDRVKFTYTWGTGKDIWHDYTLRGGGEERHKIVFCYEGCQYVEVVGAVPEGDPNPDGLPVIRSLELIHVRADNPLVGQFQCSSEMQNGAFRMIDWSIRSNMSHVPTDCPHREKNGWQEENWHMARAVSYRFDIRDWYRKVAQDLRDTQLDDGHVPTNVPNYLVGLPPHGFWNEAPEWGVSSVLVPWHLYEWYGDKETLAESFESMKRFVDYLSSTAEDGVIDSNLGDWYDYGHGLGDGPSRWTPTKVSATAIWALGAKTVADAAGVLGRFRDEPKYRRLFAEIRESFLSTFYDPETKTVKNNGSCQAGNCTALVVGLIPEEDRDGALDAVIADLDGRGWQQTTGEVLQVFLVRALGEAGRNDVLHKVYAREERGGYGFMVNQGLTTLPESWDAKPGTGNSMNHFMLGHLMEWHFAYVAGIRQAAGSVGWNKVVIQPNPGPLESAQATFDSPAGKIAVAWKHTDGKFEMDVSVPRGVSAEILLPNGARSTQGPGTRKYECDLP